MQKTLTSQLNLHFLSNKQLTTLHKLLSYNVTMRCMYFSQSWLAKKLTCDRSTMSRILSYLADAGYILKYYRQSKTCEYEIAPLLLQPDVQQELKCFFTNFFKFSISFITSIASSVALCTQLTLLGNNILNSMSVSEINSARAGARGMLVTRGERPLVVSPPQATHSFSSKKNKKGKLVISEPTLHAISVINGVVPLSSHGIAKLSVHSAAALEFAAKVAHVALSKYDPFAYIANLCHEFDSKSGFVPDWEAYHLRREALGIAKEDSVFLDYQRLSQEQSQASVKTPAAPTHKRESHNPSAQWKPSYRHMDSEERIANINKVAQVMDIKKDVVPPKNSAAYFAHILAFGAPVAEGTKEEVAPPTPPRSLDYYKGLDSLK